MVDKWKAARHGQAGGDGKLGGQVIVSFTILYLFIY